MELLREVIYVKKSKVKTFEKDFIVLKRKLREALDIIVYTHICCLFLNKNDMKLKHQQDIHSKKLFDLGLENSQTSHDPDPRLCQFLYFICDVIFDKLSELRQISCIILH